MSRFILNKIVLFLSTLSAILGIGFLLWILITLTYKGLNAISLELFTKDLVNGGIRNLLVGQFTMAIIASALAVPIGMFAGIWLREYSNDSKLAFIIRNLSDIMMSAPSIVIGVFVFAIFVDPFGSYNGIAGIIALTVMMIPIIINTTDNMLALIPKELREAGIALGGSKHKIILQIVIKAAKVGITTGVLLSFARIIGETGPIPIHILEINQFFYHWALTGQVSIFNQVGY